MADGWKASAKARLKSRRHRPGWRQLFDAIEWGYEMVREVGTDAARPAVAGGRPIRLLPLPPPRPYGSRELRELRKTVRAQNTSFFDGGGVIRFEAGLKHWWGCEHAVAVSSGTAALHTALIALGIGRGDEVIVPVLTYVSTALAVLYQGATPRFVDADPDHWAIDATRIEAAITPRTRAIVVMHPAGVPGDLDAIREVARRHGLPVVEDAAQAHGSRYRGKQVGTLGELGCLSFQSAKTMTTGEGGAVLTGDDELARRARLGMNLGESVAGGGASLEAADFSPGAELRYDSLGWNYRPSALQAALGVGQLARLDEICERRRRNAARLRERLADLEGLSMQGVTDGAEPCYTTLCFELAGGGELAEGGRTRRDEFVRALAAERIDYRLPTHRPLASYPIFDRPGSFPVANRICESCVGLRVDPSLGRRELDGTARAVHRIVSWIDSR